MFPPNLQTIFPLINIVLNLLTTKNAQKNEDATSYIFIGFPKVIIHRESGSLPVLPHGYKTAFPRQLSEIFDGGEISLFWLELSALNAMSVLFSPGE